MNYLDGKLMDRAIKEATNSERILHYCENLLVVYCIPDADIYTKNIVSFLRQCPDDGILGESSVRWDSEEKELDILWDTANLDVRFSIGLTSVRWRAWIGENHHRKDDKCYSDGFGGEDITDDEIFAYCFFDNLNDFWQEHKDYWKPYDGEV